MIGVHLLFGYALSFINSNLFPKFIKIAFDSLQLINVDSEESYQQFDSHFEKFYGISEFYAELINKFSDVFKEYPRSMQSQTVNKNCETKAIKQEFLYKCLCSVIDTKLKQPYQHQALVEAMNVYIDLLEESRIYQKDFKCYSIEEFQANFLNWFNETYIFLYKPQSFFNFLAFGIKKMKKIRQNLKQQQKKQY